MCLLMAKVNYYQPSKASISCEYASISTITLAESDRLLDT